MESLLNVSPGLIIWTIINFSIFLFIILKFGAKPIINGLKAREDRINAAINDAEKANAEAQSILKQSQEKLDSAQKEMSEIIAKGRTQAEQFLQKASEEAELIKKKKLDEALREIDRSTAEAIKSLRAEVAGLVIGATEKILDERLDDERQRKLIESYLEKIPQN
jgi:F-type H+-transporting ATPase subunit b